jgi:hypothetical protein
MYAGRALKVAFALVAAVALEGQAGQVIDGRWMADGQWVQMNTLCTQAWICVPVQSTMYSSEFRLAGPDREVTWGACNVAGGDVSNCNSCAVSPPSPSCTLTLQPR